VLVGVAAQLAEEEAEVALSEHYILHIFPREVRAHHQQPDAAQLLADVVGQRRAAELPHEAAQVGGVCSAGGPQHARAKARRLVGVELVLLLVVQVASVPMEWRPPPLRSPAGRRRLAPLLRVVQNDGAPLRIV
jgi:hypothetical protein